MKKSKHSEEKIIGAVKQLEAGRAVKELARELGVTDQTLYNWKSKYGGMDVSDAKRLKGARGRESPPRTHHASAEARCAPRRRPPFGADAAHASPGADGSGRDSRRRARPSARLRLHRRQRPDRPRRPRGSAGCGRSRGRRASPDRVVRQRQGRAGSRARPLSDCGDGRGALTVV